RLAAAPNDAVPFLKERFRPAPQPDPEQVQRRLIRLIADLDSEKFAVREQAARELEQMGPTAERALRQALKGRPSPELQRRVDELLDKLDVSSSEQVQQSRAVEVLEQIGSAEARRVLEAWVRVATEDRMKEDLAGALERLTVRTGAAR